MRFWLILVGACFGLLGSAQPAGNSGGMLSDYCRQNQSCRLRLLTVTSTLTLRGNVTISGNIVPSADVTYSLGSTAVRWLDIYVREIKQLTGGIRASFGGADYSMIQGADANDAAAVGVSIGNLTDLTDAAAKSLRVCRGNATTCTNEMASINASTGHYNTTAKTMPTGSWETFANQGVALPEDATSFRTPFQSQGSATGGTFQRIACRTPTAGVGGATGVVLKIRNVTDGTDLCSCTWGACNATASTCQCNAAFTQGKFYDLQVSSSTDCGTNPTDMYCSVEIAR